MLNTFIALLLSRFLRFVIAPPGDAPHYFGVEYWRATRYQFGALEHWRLLPGSTRGSPRGGHSVHGRADRPGGPPAACRRAQRGHSSRTGPPTGRPASVRADGRGSWRPGPV